MKEYDFIVISSGPAGRKAAIQAAKFDKHTAVIERRDVFGGVAHHPSKTLREAVLYLTGWNQRGLYGNCYRLKSKVTLDDLMQRVQITLKHQIEIVQDQLARNNVEVSQGVVSLPSGPCLQVKSVDDEISETPLLGTF